MAGVRPEVPVRKAACLLASRRMEVKCKPSAEPLKAGNGAGLGKPVAAAIWVPVESKKVTSPVSISVKANAALAGQATPLVPSRLLESKIFCASVLPLIGHPEIAGAVEQGL